MINKKRPGTTDDQSPECMLKANGQSTVSPVERCVRGVWAFARRALQDPEARSDLGPTSFFGPRLHRASVTTGLGGASVRGSTEPRWRFGEIKNGWIWCNLAHIWWIHEACGGGCGRGRWDPPDQREIRRDPGYHESNTHQRKHKSESPHH